MSKYSPLVHGWEMSAIVEADEKGRILLPIEVRRKFRARRYKVTAREDRIEIQPLVGVKELKGKYRDIITGEWDELEEKGAEFVEAGRR